ncbi:MAG: hypothetical protein EBR73_16255 [Rhodobacteraceae bacterium]|jgi:hypothetical protein|nr:hypothetical protein [Paracoccaceae bacterium]
MRYLILDKTRVSFDYDGVLSTDAGKEKAKQFIRDGFHVYILTARSPKEGDTVYNTAESLGIKRDDVIFTSGQDKWRFVLRHNIDRHYDNNPEQIDKINEKTQAKGILI